ncbi:cytochrome c biogenesis protein CcdA [Candidatus Woesearchaeota archaeon]|nr:cytochrome c biogenesis protein CcdA [Candidatus Woesearchaeota archaeon]
MINLWISFIAGFLAPLTAVCIIPMYPAFLSYLANKTVNKSKLTLSLIVTSGIICSMFLFGLIFTFIFQKSLSFAISIISPIFFGILALISILLIFDYDIGKFIPRIKTARSDNPYLSSFLFGFFFGGIILPCNPATLAVLFAISSSTTQFLTNLLNFVLFGVGMSIPLFILALMAKSDLITSFLVRNKRTINLLVGITMLSISIYYLIFVFEIFG